MENDDLKKKLKDSQNELGTEEIQELEKVECLEVKNKLDKTVLGGIAVGLMLLFALMMVINGYIFSYFSEGREGYYISIFTSDILFLCLILIIKKLKRLEWSDLGWKPIKGNKIIIQIVRVWLLTWAINIAYLSYLTARGIKPPENELYTLVANPTVIVLLLNIIIMVVIAPIIEETIFRGFLLGGLRNYCGKWTAVIVSAMIFSALHMDIIGFFTRLVLGIALGYLYVKRESIYSSMILHGLNNLFAVLVTSYFS